MQRRNGNCLGVIGVLALCLSGEPASAALSRNAVNQAEFRRPVRDTEKIQPVLIKAQVLLDRALVSPGAIDGRYSANTQRALRVFQQRKGLPVSGKLDAVTWRELTRLQPDEVLGVYRITRNDVNGPFLRRIPSNPRQMAKLRGMHYTSPRELLAERFHMSEALLKALNPKVDFKKAGTSIVVPRVSDTRPPAEVASVVVDKVAHGVKCYDREGKLVVFYPASIGSAEFPSPSGQLKVTGIARNPTYTLSSRLKYVRLKPGQTITVPPGPNSPVGVVWIALSKRGYGIHGTAHPELIRMRESHGCVRLTNWDARELSMLLHNGVPVRFIGPSSATSAG